ncbi:MAG: efflux RND transporter permease subunit [Deltaproteobacteria bacterium]|nr:MAG: efflux RND transporter permease subunit [Deltaproteobacteria bacterium]
MTETRSERDRADGARTPGWARGPLAWMAKNPVAANVVMLTLVAGGLILSSKIRREVFPEFDLDIISVSIPYPGASPEEVEKGVSLVVEEAVRGIDGVKRVSSYSRENQSVVIIEVLLGHDAERVLSDVESAVARIASFPEDIEEPTISLFANRTRVLSLVVYGDGDAKAVRAFAERTRDELLADDRITYVEMSAVRPLEISIEVPQDKLRQYGLTLDAIAARIRQEAVELPAGAIKTPKGEVLLRTAERRDTGDEFRDVTLISRPDGSKVTVGDIAVVKDGFAETDQEAFFNGKPAAIIDVFRVGDETPITVSDAVKDLIARSEGKLPDGMHYAIWLDTSEWYASRMNLLMRNAAIGLVLVMFILGLFLEIKLAFWVTLGIPISFIGSLFFLPMTDVTINMISLFAFILVLGMVVDDAIVVGEATYLRRTQGASRIRAAIDGVREVAIPVVFAVVTTCIAFAPMLFVPGPAGKFFRVIPITVITVLLLSLFESLFILPAHLAHSVPTRHRGVFGWIHRRQQQFSRRVEWFVEHVYGPTLRRAVRRRYVTIAVAFAFLIAAFGLVAGGRVEQTFIPKIEQDNITAEIRLPFGSSVDDTRRAVQTVLRAAQQTIDQFGGEQISRGVFAQVGAQTMARVGDPAGSFGKTAGHLGEVAVSLVPAEQRNFTSSDFVRVWRRTVGDLVNVESLRFSYSTGAGAGPALDFQLSHRDVDVIEAAASELAQRLAVYEGVSDIDDGFDVGKEQLDFRMKPEGLARGLTAADLGRQVRSAYFGAEVLRQQRGRNEVKVYVRLPRDERDSEYHLEQFIVRTPGGGEMPLGRAAEIVRNRAYTAIKRVDGRRVVDVLADVDEQVSNAEKVTASVMSEVLPEIAARYPGLTYRIGGEQEQRRDAVSELFKGFAVALVAMVALLAMAFRSYVQWLVVMIVIPFGFVGALIGHIVMGFDLSLMSLMGIVALAGVVINDSLILIVAINEFRATGLSMFDAVVEGGLRRFRPIILTSLTTFFGLMPMILEKSVQARFLVPMAISLGFGVMFATFITLLMVPALYAIVDDVRRGLLRLLGLPAGPVATAPPAGALQHHDAAGKLGG